MTRIQPEPVNESFSKIGMKPAKFTWFNNSSCCGLTALGIYTQLFTRDELKTIPVLQIGSFIKEKLISLGFDDHYLSGFIAGFDGEKPSTSAPREYSFGYDDGVVVRVKCFV